MSSETTNYPYNNIESVTISCIYDPHGNKASVSYPNGITTHYAYDTLNRLTSVTHTDLTQAVIASYAYELNSKGMRTEIKEYAGTQLVSTIRYTYDPADRLVEERIETPLLGGAGGGSTTRTISYTYDPVGNRIQKNDNGTITTYSYDDNDRLLTETPLLGGIGGGFTYTYGYDDNGNMLSKTGNEETWQLTYNALNQLTQADISTPQGSTTVAYTYDHDGIRVGKTLNGTDVVTYVVDKNRPYAQVLEEQWTRGTLTSTVGYVYGDDLLARTGPSTGSGQAGMTQYYLYDGLGSTRALSDANGSLTDTYSYDAYGQLLTSTGPGDNPSRYRGEQYDSALDAYYLRARYYQPGIGRFLTTDPVEGFQTNPMTQHRYAYGNNNPISYIDPSGKMTLNEQLVVGAIITNLIAFGAGHLLDSYGYGYSSWGEKILPDAFIVGVNWNYISVDLVYWLNWVTGTLFGTGGILSPGQVSLNYFEGGELELLLSVSSAEAAIFSTTFSGSEFGHGLPIISSGIELYNGSVFNLWNADDYEGPFEAYTIGLVPWSKSLFWDGKRVFDGPWGAAKPVLSKSLSVGTNTTKVSGSYTAIDYKYEEEKEPLPSQGHAVFLILGVLAMEKVFIEQEKATNPYNLFWSLVDVSIWGANRNSEVLLEQKQTSI